VLLSVILFGSFSGASIRGVKGQSIEGDESSSGVSALCNCSREPSFGKEDSTKVGVHGPCVFEGGYIGNS
jgi:hypothetical protein